MYVVYKIGKRAQVHKLNKWVDAMMDLECGHPLDHNYFNTRKLTLQN